MEIRSYRDLIVWQKAVSLVTDVYKLTTAFPCEEMYGLTSQLRRAAVSVPSNIAEGHGRATKGEYIQFLCHARGSLCEVETQMIISQHLGYVSQEKGEQVIARSKEVGRILNGLIASLQPKRRPPVASQAQVLSSLTPGT